jgi:paired amphipathic helix protein Sin3a
MTTTIRILPKTESTYDLTNELDTPGALTEPQRWDYYISTYNTFQPTEGVRHTEIQHSVLMRNYGLALKLNNSLSLTDADIARLDETEARRLDRTKNSELLCLRISPATYSISFDNASATNVEWWIGVDSARSVKASTEKDGEAKEGAEVPAMHPEAVHHEEIEQSTRAGMFEEKFVMNNAWMKGLTRDAVEVKNTEYRQWKEVEA